VQTLIPEPFAAAEQWCRREGVIPINHMFVVHQDLSNQHPEIVKEIYRMLVESRNLAPESATATLPPVGLEANRKALQMAMEWSFEQKIIPRRLSFDELFDDTTASLG
jgi:4,5-dihydroxyphthalate decarboxylase